MRAVRWLSTAMLLVALPSAMYPLIPTLSPDTESLTLRARSYRLVRQSNGELQLELTGAVELLYGDRRLRTELLQLDTAKAVVYGETPFELLAPEGRLRGLGLEYFYERQRGRFRQVEALLYPPLPTRRGEVGGAGTTVHLWAQEMEGDLQRFEAHAVRATTCERDPPDFTVEAARVRLIGGERLRLFNARLRWKGRTLLSLPMLTLRLRERRETLELPTPTYSPDTGVGARYQLELPIGARALFALSGAFYMRAIPETRLALAFALRGDAPVLTEPELSQRLESSALYNLRIAPDRERAALDERATTLRVEHAADVRPLLARDARLRVSRPFEIAFSTGFAAGDGVGGLTLRLGQMRERRDQQRTPTLRRLALETEWLQPLLRREPFELSLHFWASHVRYEGTNRLDWLRPQIELRYQPSENLKLMLGYALTRTRGSTPFMADRVVARNELALRGEGVFGNLRLGALLKYDIERRDLYDLQLLIGWRQHCIEPFLYWRRTPSVLLLGVSLTGLH
ncbi:MAG: hypothetical protein NZL85_02900 [Fimbriimonadales bacterium]|nr:hypothetical protein [Fimbriimonadales bacterium]